MTVGKVYKVYVYLSRAGRGVGYFSADLIFVADIPQVVIEWKETVDGDLPAVTVPLDPACLHKLDPPWPTADYVYETGIVDPRRFS